MRQNIETTGYMVQTRPAPPGLHRAGIGPSRGAKSRDADPPNRPSSFLSPLSSFLALALTLRVSVRTLGSITFRCVVASAMVHDIWLTPSIAGQEFPA